MDEILPSCCKISFTLSTKDITQHQNLRLRVDDGCVSCLAMLFSSHELRVPSRLKGNHAKIFHSPLRTCTSPLEGEGVSSNGPIMAAIRLSGRSPVAHSDNRRSSGARDRAARSLVSDSGSIRRTLDVPGDTQAFTVQVVPGQSITVLVDSGDSLQASVELTDPASTSLGASTGSTAGQDVILQTVPATAGGTYTVSLGGIAATTGEFNLHMILNAAVEEEDHDGPANDTRATAQDLSGAFVPLLPPGSGKDRAAVLGNIRGGTETGDLFFVRAIQSEHRPRRRDWQGAGSIQLPRRCDVRHRTGDQRRSLCGVAPPSGPGQLCTCDYEANLLDTIPLPSGYYGDTGLDVAADGSLWVTQPNASQVLHLDASGNLLTSFAFAPELRWTAAVRNDGQVFVSSQLWRRVAARSGDRRRPVSLPTCIRPTD